MKNNFLSKGTFEDEWVLHQQIAQKCKIGIVEIGVLEGFTTKIFLENSNVKVYGIDPIISDSMNREMIGSVSKIEELQKNFNRFEFIKDFSYNVVKNWGNSFDYIFIDGDHNYEAVKNDFESWLPLLSDGGYISIHDSSCNRGGPYWWPGPSQLADELLNDKRVEYIDTVFSLTLFKKII